MDDVLPNFKPVENSPVLSSAEMQHLLFKPTDRRLENAQQACKSLDVCRASLTIQHLQRAGIPAEDLQLCLLGAVESEAYDLIRVLLLAGVPLSALVIKPALEQNSLRTLSMFREHGWEINREEAWCIPPWLSLAIATNPQQSLVSWFLENGADPDMACQMGTTPLSTAVARAPLSIVEMLFQSCADPTTLQGQLLHFAARRCDDEGSEVLRLVLDRCKPDVNSQMWQDCPLAYECYKLTGLGTALHEVARTGRPNLAMILIAHGADACIQDSCGRTALEVAQIAGNEPVRAFLSEYKGNS